MKSNNNDFDFIKNKFDTDGVSAPDNLDSSFVINTIADKSPKRVKFPTKRVVAGVASGLVACVAAFAIVFTSITGTVVNHPPIVADAGVLPAFDSYDDIKSTLHDMGVVSVGKYYYSNIVDKALGHTNKGWVNDSAIDDADAIATESMAEGVASFSNTYRQVADVDEADIVKTDGKYIYTCINGDLIIYSAKDGKTEQVANFAIDGSYGIIEELFVNGDQLVVSVSDYQKAITTTTYIYDLTDITKPAVAQKYTQSGSYSTSRMIGNKVYIVSNQYIEKDTDVPYIVCKDKKTDLPPQCVSCVENPSNSAYLVVGMIDLDSLDSDVQTKAILGASDDVYCNNSNMYVINTIYDYSDPSSDYIDDEVAYVVPYINTQIIRISLDDGIKFVATGTVDGVVDSRYALDEHDGRLRVATTSQNNDGVDVNNLLVLDMDLKELGAVKGFAPTESVKAVRYIGDYAYVITYEQTDPLFIIDLINPTNPIILGEAKIDGFSTMLVPVGDDRLLGIGYYTKDVDYTDMQVASGIKLVLFDISDKTQPAVLDEKVFADYASAVQNDPRAFVFNPTNGKYMIPFFAENWEYNTGHKSGAIEFSISNDKIVGIKERVPSNLGLNDDIDRTLYIDDYIYMLAGSGNLYTDKY